MTTQTTLKSRIQELVFDGKKTKEIFEIVKQEFPSTSYNSVANNVCMYKKELKKLNQAN